MRFQTNNLVFRELDKDDKLDVYHLFSDPKVLTLDQSDEIKELKDAEFLIKKAKELNRTPYNINWGVELVSEKKIIGTCGFKNWDRISRHAEIGGNLSSEFWGKGYATEAVHALLEFGFRKMSLHKITASTNCKNQRAIKVLDKYGFQRDGVLREHQLLDGEFIHVYTYSLLKKEFPSF
ncbi:GNAT family N-acetyltransferase [Evansella tamaricis]|uniref:GNAT family N-acetyltransferase n=1 Tax=Evansella tamaricis TaxID=2069301 RepID=A0ABS6JH32_9BACI|nr:GNAT family protein [Evansella tamaricis]MBU9711785.1 GNAT family N-acetyltransferase [Evansella tamaricis]